VLNEGNNLGLTLAFRLAMSGLILAVVLEAISKKYMHTEIALMAI
jgi:hypothetical protein